jgi:hypothetical protein
VLSLGSDWSKRWRCALPSCFNRYSIHDVRECRQDSLFNRGSSLDLLFLAIIWLVRPLYIFPILFGSFSALWSCSPMHARYATLTPKGPRKSKQLFAVLGRLLLMQ